MISASSTRAVPQNATEAILLLSLLWLCPLAAPAAEPSQVPAALPPQFSLPDLAGRPRSLNEFEDRVVLVTFWASWCRPCIEEIPGIQRLIAAMADAPFAVIGVNVGETERRAQTAAMRLGIEFPVLLDKDSDTFNSWGAEILPTAYVLDRSGRVRSVAHGPVEWDRVDIIEMLKRLAAEQQPGHE